MGLPVLVTLLLLAATSVACDPEGTNTDLSRVVPFEMHPLPDAGADFEEWPPITVEQRSLQATLSAVPKEVLLPDDLRYIVTLHNRGDDAVSLDPCPAYYSAWGESATAYFGFGFLNCEQAPSEIPAHSGVRFEMVIDLPKDPERWTSYPGTIIWRLQGAEGQTKSAFSRIVVVRA